MAWVLLYMVCLFRTSACTAEGVGHGGADQRIAFGHGPGPQQVHVHTTSTEEILNGLPASEKWKADLEDSDLRWEVPEDAVKSVGNPRSMTNRHRGNQSEGEETNHAKWAIPVAASLALVLPSIVFVAVFCYCIFTFDFTSEERDANGMPPHRHSVRKTVVPVEAVQKASSEIQCGVIILCNTADPDCSGDLCHE